ncbi:MAG: tetratricopeptide repeat protein, partial [Proteobacteria bacterium]|nr:tetratricopeptide repeat protein [Pseudomonadota bacterium]
RGQKARFIDAARDIDAALALAPHDSDLMLSKAVIEAGTGKFDNALKWAESAVETDPGNWAGWGYVATLHLTARRVPSAIQALERAVALAPDNSDVNGQLGMLLVSSGKPRQALPHLDVAIKAQPLEQNHYLWRARGRTLVGDYPGGLKDFTSLLDGPMPNAQFTLVGDLRSVILAERALVKAALGDMQAAADDMYRSAEIGGQQRVLQVQLFLRRQGLASPIDGKPSDELKTSLRNCFVRQDCRIGLVRNRA